MTRPPDERATCDRAAAVLYDSQLRLLASHFDNMGDGRHNSATYVANYFHELFGIASPGLFVEAGAYRGEASRRIKSEHASCRVVAFEANPYNHARYAEELDFAANEIEYVNAAVTDVDGPVTFHLRRRQDGQVLRPVTGNSSLLRLEAADVEYEEIEVAGVTLDSQFRGFTARAAIWIDAEGASQQVLAGAAQLLERTDVILIEVEEQPKWQNQWTALDVTGFLLASGFIPVTRDIEYEHQHNVIFVSAGMYRHPAVLMSLELHLNYLRHHMGGALR